MRRRKARFLKNETPYWSECLDCQLSCIQTIQRGETSFGLETCPKRHDGDPAFPYAYKQKMEKWYMKNGRE